LRSLKYLYITHLFFCTNVTQLHAGITEFKLNIQLITRKIFISWESEILTPNWDITFQSRDYNFTFRNVRSACDRKGGMWIISIRQKWLLFLKLILEIRVISYVDFTTANLLTIDCESTWNMSWPKKIKRLALMGGDLIWWAIVANQVLFFDRISREHTDGFDMWIRRFSRHDDISSMFRLEIQLKFKINLTRRCGLVYIRNTTICGKERHDDFSCCFRRTSKQDWIFFLNILYTRRELKEATCTDIRTTQSPEDSASQDFLLSEDYSSGRNFQI
jgi:hypothetical protein